MSVARNDTEEWVVLAKSAASRNEPKEVFSFITAAPRSAKHGWFGTRPPIWGSGQARRAARRLTSFEYGGRLSERGIQ